MLTVFILYVWHVRVLISTKHTVQLSLMVSKFDYTMTLNEKLTNFLAINAIVVRPCQKPQMLTCWWCNRNCQEVIKVIRPLGIIHFRRTFCVQIHRVDVAIFRRLSKNFDLLVVLKENL